VDEIFDRLARPSRALPLLDVGAAAASALQPVARTSQADYQAAVRRIQEYIKAGDAFQVVLSQRFDVARDGVDPSTCIASCGSPIPRRTCFTWNSQRLS